VNLCNKDGTSPLYLACENGYLQIVCRLLESKADANKTDKHGFSLDANLCNYKGSSLLDFKVDVNKCDNDDRSPLYVACVRGYTDIVEVLLVNNADINLFMFDGDSPLIISCTAGHSNIVEMLLKEGADVTKCLQNETQKLIKAGWLYFIMERANNKLKLYLLGISQCKFYDVIRGFSPLHMTCLMGHIKIIELFLAQNLDVNICKEDGTTPLYVACEVGHTEVVRLLLENKADPHIYRNDGKSPFIVAESNEHFDIMSILKQYITL
jgi:ankyrin repeat protein